MSFTYASVCSGIGAPECAWSGLPWHCAFSAEIEPFPAAVYHHHFPEVPNYGDITQFKVWPHHSIRLLVGGTPCQSFSVAGLRKGLADPRGNLALTFLALVERYGPAWVVWENVPGVLSDQGNAFGAFLGGLGQLGYGFAYGVLDAQWFGVAQRRRRVFVVGHSGGQWQRAAAVLFDTESLRGNPAPSRESWQRPAPTIGARTKGGGGLGTDAECGGAVIAHTLGTQNVDGRNERGDGSGNLLVAPPLMFGSGHEAGHNARSGHCKDAHITVVHSLRSEGFDASEDGTGWGTPLVPECSPALKSRDCNANACPDELKVSDINDGLTLSQNAAVAFTERTRKDGRTFECQEDIAYALCNPGSGGRTHSRQIAQGYAVRRLTPTECERLQGFPDGWTAITYRGKPAADGPRYRALGNSMAVPVVRWLGQRIQLVEAGAGDRAPAQ